MRPEKCVDFLAWISGYEYNPHSVSWLGQETVKDGGAVGLCMSPTCEGLVSPLR